ncbi:MAG: hypothetical protein RLZZ436_4208 [Planctomycetota bacterium]|jgi:type III secretion protein T
MVTDQFMLIVILAAIRPLAAGLAMPFLGGNLLQGPLKRSVTLSIALLTVPRVNADSMSGISVDALDLMVLIAKEMLLGFCWGLAATKSYYVALGVGAFIDNQRGATIANVINPATSEESSLFGDMLQQIFIIAFFASGGMHHYLSGFYSTYKLWPVLTWFPVLDDRLPEYFFQFLSSLAMLTVSLAMPVVAAMFICEFGLGLINRFAQALNVFFIAMPLKSLIAVFVLILYFEIFMHALLQNPAAPLDLLEVFRPERTP